MICSMTAFARESSVTSQGVLTVELRSVNHRYLDCSFKLPDSLRQLEPRLREAATKKLARGKLDCMIKLQSNPEQTSEFAINHEQLEKLLEASAVIKAQLPDCQPLNPLDVLHFPGICRSSVHSDDEILNDAMKLFGEAISSLLESRKREGEKLAAMVLERLELVSQEVLATRAIMPDLMQQQRNRVITRIQELDIEVDSNRLEQELVHLAQKADVDEELDRLQAHVSEVRRTLKKGGPCGRRLDFLMQELNREANTLSSKSVSSSTTQNAVELKVLIEQMREQIQNIE
ncbi:MAG: YicC/YloC family endoribonuclease [Halioglobus sp.]